MASTIAAATGSPPRTTCVAASRSPRCRVVTSSRSPAPLDASDAEPSLATLQAAFDRFCRDADVRLRELAWITVWRPNVAAGAPVPGRKGVPRRRRRPRPPANRRAGPQHRRAGRLQPRVEAGRGAGAGPEARGRRRCSTATRPSACPSRQGAGHQQRAAAQVRRRATPTRTSRGTETHQLDVGVPGQSAGARRRVPSRAAAGGRPRSGRAGRRRGRAGDPAVRPVPRPARDG